MKLLKLSVIVLTSICSTATFAIGPPEREVMVVNDDTNPVPVRNVEPSERLQDEALFYIGLGTTGASKAVLDIPEGKMAIVKFVSGRGYTPVDSFFECDVVPMVSDSTPLGGVGSAKLITHKSFRTSDYQHKFSQEIEFYVWEEKAGFTCRVFPAPASDMLLSVTMTAILVDANGD